MNRQKPELQNQEISTVFWIRLVLSILLLGVIFTLAMMLVAEEQEFIVHVVGIGWITLFYTICSYFVKIPPLWARMLILLEVATILGLSLLLWRNEVNIFSDNVNIASIGAIGFGIIFGVPASVILVNTTIKSRSQAERTPSSNRKIRYIYLIPLMSVLIFTIYRNQCEIVPCDPATWEDIYNIIQHQAEHSQPAYLIGDIRAEPSFRSKFTEEGPYDIIIRIELYSPVEDPAQPGWYQVNQFELNDRDQWVTWNRSGSWAGDLPSDDSQQRLQRVRISPRDVYRATWKEAQKQLSDTDLRSYSWMILTTESSVPQSLGVESAWLITYMDSSLALEYWIDAWTGEILQSTKEVYRQR